MKTTTNKKTKTDAATSLKLLELVRLEPPTTKEALMELCQRTTRLTLECDAAQVKLDRRVLDLNEAHAPLIEAMRVEIDRGVKLMHLWAVANREAEFGGCQGIEVAGCTLEFRKGTGRVQAEQDEETVVDRLLSLPASQQAKQQALVRLKATLNKQAVIAMAKTEEGMVFLRALGLEIVEEETFKFTAARNDLTPLTVVGGRTAVAA